MRSPDELFGSHGAAMFSLARFLVADQAAIEGVVTHAIFDVCSRPVSDRGERWEIARYVYIRCARSDEPDSHLGDSGPGTLAVSPTLAALTSQQRTVIGLSLFGGHTYGEIAALTNLPQQEVASLLRTGLQAVLSVAGDSGRTRASGE